jgi:hypothetical protein
MCPPAPCDPDRQWLWIGEEVLVDQQVFVGGARTAVCPAGRSSTAAGVRPSGAPDPAHCDQAKLRGVPHLRVWDDYRDRHPFWVHSLPHVQRWRYALAAAGADFEWIDLPARGIKSNSHALMADDNNDLVGTLVLDWMRQRNLIG